MPNIIDFKSKLNGGVRPNLYQVDINFPSGNENLTRDGRYLCRSASLPTHSQGLIEVPFRGRFLKIPGDRTFEAWTATFYNTSDFNLRAAFETWINMSNQTNINVGVEAGFGSFFKDIVIRQLSKDSNEGQTTLSTYGKDGNLGGDSDPNKVLRSYRLVDAWPTSVGSINVAFDSNDALEEFDVEFQYQYLDASNPAEPTSEPDWLSKQGSVAQAKSTLANQ